MSPSEGKRWSHKTVATYYRRHLKEKESTADAAADNLITDKAQNVKTAPTVGKLKKRL